MGIRAFTLDLGPWVARDRKRESNHGIFSNFSEQGRRIVKDRLPEREADVASKQDWRVHRDIEIRIRVWVRREISYSILRLTR